MARRAGYSGEERRQVERRGDPRRVEDRRGGTARPREQRAHKRFAERLRARLFRPSEGQKGFDFSANINTGDLSVGGAYLESSFQVQSKAPFELELHLEHHGWVVRATAEIVNVNRDARGKPPGFGVRFLRFHDDGEILLRAFLTRGDMYEFCARFLGELPKPLRLTPERLVELLVRWQIVQERVGDG